MGSELQGDTPNGSWLDGRRRGTSVCLAGTPQMLRQSGVVTWETSSSRVGTG